MAWRTPLLKEFPSTGHNVSPTSERVHLDGGVRWRQPRGIVFANLSGTQRTHGGEE